MSKININYDDLANQVISKLADRLCNPEFIKNEIKKKFSEDLRLTMIGYLEDMDVSLVTEAIIDTMKSTLHSDEFLSELTDALAYRANIGHEDSIRLSAALVNNSNIINIIENQNASLRAEINDLRGNLYELNNIVHQLMNERGS